MKVNVIQHQTACSELNFGVTPRVANQMTTLSHYFHFNYNEKHIKMKLIITSIVFAASLNLWILNCSFLGICYCCFVFVRRLIQSYCTFRYKCCLKIITIKTPALIALKWNKHIPVDAETVAILLLLIIILQSELFDITEKTH